MTRLLKSICLSTFVLFFSSTFVLAEEITITTYYPSPYGSYNYLQVDKLGVGDNNGDASFTSADVPTTSGYAWIKGRVGIGTMSPDTELHIFSSAPTIKLESSDGATAFMEALGTNEAAFGTSGGIPVKFYTDGTGTPKVTILNSGYVGIGTTNPHALLDVEGNINVFDAAEFIREAADKLRINNQGSAGSYVRFTKAGPTEFMRIQMDNGRVGIGTTAPGYALDVIGQIRMSGTSGTKSVVADVAEVIPVADDVEEGDVVSIDNTVKTYQFAKAKTPDSLLVAGVISSTDKNSKSVPALFIGDSVQKEKENPNQKYKYLAIAGQIAVKVCLEGGTIKKGDLLTTSSLAGYAMKSQNKQPGTLIGKALEDFDGKDGVKGTIIALIGLM